MIRPFLIFLVDDDPLFLKMVGEQLDQTRVLRNYDFKIESFTVGESCVEHLSEKPDVVILDYLLDTNIEGAENGLKILKQIKALSPSTVVFMISSQDNLKVANALHEAGADDYIMKNENAFFRIDKAVLSLFDNLNFRLKIKTMNNRNRIFKIAIFILLGIILLLSIKLNSCHR